jgi:hypothetical protein
MIGKTNVSHIFVVVAFIIWPTAPTRWHYGVLPQGFVVLLKMPDENRNLPIDQFKDALAIGRADLLLVSVKFCWRLGCSAWGSG